jgi:hypothetical protein
MILSAFTSSARPQHLFRSCRIPARQIKQIKFLLRIVNHRHFMMSLLITNVLTGLFQVFSPRGLMVLISTPKTTSRKSLSETWMTFKNMFCTPRLQHNLCILDRILFGQINLEMNMIASKTKILEFKTKSPHFIKSSHTGVDVRLLPETAMPVLGDKNHGHPVISGVTRNLFRATATYIFQNYSSCRANKVQARSGLPRATYFRNCYSEKKVSTFHLRTFVTLSPRSILGLKIKKLRTILKILINCVTDLNN